MKCPVCNVELKIYVRQSIEVDYCPQCRGVWLDRGELDKIIEASLAENPATIAPSAAPPASPGAPLNSVPPVNPTVYPQPNYQQGNYQQPNYRHKDYDDDDDDDYRYRGQHHGQHGHDPRYDKYGKRKKRGVLGEIFDIFD